MSEPALRSAPGRLRPSAGFAARVTAAFGDEGLCWLGDLAATQARLADLWDLSIGSQPAGGRSACVRYATTSAGTEAVLKIPVRRHEALSERLALAYWNGHGMVKLLDVDEVSGAFLLERLRGQPLTGAPGDAEALLAAAANLLRTLHEGTHGPQPELPTLQQKIGPLRALREREERRRGGSTLGHAARRREEAVREWLEATCDPLDTRVIHGDLHPRNVLLRPDGRLTAIDPYGVVGEPARDAAYLALMLRADDRGWERVTAMAGLAGLDPDRVRGHAYLIASGACRTRHAYGMVGSCAHLHEYIARFERQDGRPPAALVT